MLKNGKMMGAMEMCMCDLMRVFCNVPVSEALPECDC